MERVAPDWKLRSKVAGSIPSRDSNFSTLDCKNNCHCRLLLPCWCFFAIWGWKIAGMARDWTRNPVLSHVPTNTLPAGLILNQEFLNLRVWLTIWLFPSTETTVDLKISKTVLYSYMDLPKFPPTFSNLPDWRRLQKFSFNLFGNFLNPT